MGSETPSFFQERGLTIQRWLLPREATIASRAQERRPAHLLPTMRPVEGEDGERLGSVLEVPIETQLGDTVVSCEFSFEKPDGADYSVSTHAWNSAATSTHLDFPIGGRMIGMRPYEETLGGKRIPFVEPTRGRDRAMRRDEGRSYGWIGFQDQRRGPDGGENMFLGVVPSFDAIERIRYREEDGRIVVTVEKNMEGITTARDTGFKIFIANGNPRLGGAKYGDIISAYGKELGSVRGDVPLMKDRKFGFSWVAYGKGVRQEDVEAEIEAGQGLITDYIIDDGWETVSGSFEVDTKKFPDLPGWIQRAKDMGIRPGVWTAPFMVSDPSSVPETWLIKGKNGKPIKPIPQFKFYGLDISVPEVRAHLTRQYLKLAKMGFEVFKADYSVLPFMEYLQIREKTSVECFRELFFDIRETIREEEGREVEFLGSLAPMMESIGLFNGMSITFDATLPNLKGIPRFGKALQFLASHRPVGSLLRWGQSKTYFDALAQTTRRTLPQREAYGLVLYGANMHDEAVALDAGVRDRLAGTPERVGAFIRIAHLGIDNFVIADGLARLRPEQREAWKDFAQKFSGRDDDSTPEG